MSVQLQLRRDTAANWTATNPILAQGEPGYETDTNKIKYGDGATAWNSLAYFTAGGGGGSPGGANTQLQYNNAGAFGGIATAVYDGTNLDIQDSVLRIVDNGDTTKRVQFQVSGLTTATTRTLTIPDANLTVVGIATTQTLTNKTLDNTNIVSFRDDRFTLQDDADTTKQAVFQLSSITTGTTRTLTIPDASLTLVGTATVQTLSNKTLDNTNTLSIKDTLFRLQDDGDATKLVAFELSGLTTGNTRTLTVPDSDLTIVGLTTVQTLTNKTLGNSNIFTIRDDRFTLQDDADTTKQVIFQLSSLTTATTRTLTIPDANLTIVGTTTVQTLTNKTIDVSQLLSAAFTMSANNTNASALHTTHAFQYPTAWQAYVDTPAYTGTTAPSGATDHGYQWIQVGTCVFYQLYLTYATGGTAITQVTLPKPADMPNPVEWVSGQNASERIFCANGYMSLLETSAPSNGAAGLRRNAGDTAYEFILTVSSINVRTVMVWGHYFTA